jgi:Holliday junction resolvasome RuvABC endonuclease subunit
MTKSAETARNKLAALMMELQPIIDQHVSQLNGVEINFILQNYRKYLKIDLERDLEAARTRNFNHSAFDDILNDYKSTIKKQNDQ